MMSLPPLVLAAMSWFLVFSASLLGLWIGKLLPASHKTSESKSVVSVAMAMVGTLTAIALGMLLSVANVSFKDNQEQLLSTSSDVTRLDHLFRLYGTETEGARGLLLQYSESKLADLFPGAGLAYNVENEGTLDLMARVEGTVAELSPQTKMQRWLQPRMVDTCDRIIQQHYELVKNKQDAIPAALIMLLVFWLILLFASYAIYAPRHLTSLVVFLLSSGASAGAILLILELETPERGIIRLSPEPLYHSIEVLKRHEADAG